MYLLALLCPPLAVLLTGRLFQALFSLLLLPFYFPAALWAILVVANHKADKRAERVMRASRVVQQVQVNNTVHVAQPDREQTTTTVKVERQPKQPNSQGIERRAARIAFLRALPMRTMWLLDEARVGAIKGYQALPEWGQPVVWGLAAGTPVSLIVAVLMMRR